MQRTIFECTCSSFFELEPVYHILVTENNNGGKIEYSKAQDTTHTKEIDSVVIASIKNVMLNHPDIFMFKYLEINCDVLDGVTNEFKFSPEKEKKATLHGFNMWAALEPDPGRYYSSPLENPEGKPPHKTLQIIDAFNEISKILIEQGVSSDYLKLQ